MSSEKPTCIWYSKTGISSFPGGPNCLRTAEYLIINKKKIIHFTYMLIVCIGRLHLWKRKFFWLHNVDVIWFFKDLHTSVLLLKQHHSGKKYFLQIPDSKSSHTQPILQPGHFYFRFCAAQRIWYQILLNLWQIWQHLLQCKLFFLVKLCCIQTSPVIYKYTPR